MFKGSTVTIREFLDRYFLSQRFSDQGRAEVIPFKYIATKFDIQPSASTKFLDVHPNVRLGYWVSIRGDFVDLLKDNDAKLNEIVQVPSQLKSATFGKESKMTAFCEDVFQDSICQFFPDVKIIREEKDQIGSEPDLVFMRSSSQAVIMENKGFASLNYHNHPKDVLSIFESQRPATLAKPLNQIIGYLLFNNCKYGILSDLKYSYAFRYIGLDQDQNDCFEISEPFAEEELIFLVFCLMIAAESDLRLGPREQRKTIVHGPDYDQNLPKGPSPKMPRREYKPASDKPTAIGQSINKFELFSGKRHAYQGHYSAEADVLMSRVDFEQRLAEYFGNWSFEACYLEGKGLGKGRSGSTSLGYVMNHQERIKVRCAVKIADLSKRPYLQDELENEVRVLIYLNSSGAKCVPTIRWAGCLIGMFYAIATDFIDGYQPGSLEELDESERDMFEEALVELRVFNVTHGDLKESNIIFTDQRCYIIDFGMSSITTEDTCWESLEYDLYTHDE